MTRSTSQLAIHGGEPTIPEGPPPWPPADEEVRSALVAAYEDGSWGRYEGRHSERLSNELAAMHGCEHVLLCSSGTVAVELGLRGLAVDAGDEVVLAGYDFPGNFRAIEAIGARPVLVDIHPQTWCLDAAQLESAVGPRTRAIVVSHLHGGIADMQTICEIAHARRVAVLEDVCQCPGAVVQGRMAGGWGDAAVLSFGGSKLLTAGRGGALLTSRADVHQRAKIFNERGNQAFPLSELQAAVLAPQLSKLKDRNARRAASVQLLLEACGELPGLRPLQNVVANFAPAYYKAAWLYSNQRAARSRFIAAAQAEGVAIDAGFRGFTRRTAQRCRHGGPLPHSAAASTGTLLLHHPVLLQEDAAIALVAQALRKVCERLAEGE